MKILCFLTLFFSINAHALISLNFNSLPRGQVLPDTILQEAGFNIENTGDDIFRVVKVGQDHTEIRSLDSLTADLTITAANGAVFTVDNIDFRSGGQGGGFQSRITVTGFLNDSVIGIDEFAHPGFQTPTIFPTVNIAGQEIDRLNLSFFNESTQSTANLQAINIITVIPEPTTYVYLLGAFAFIFVLLPRYKCPKHILHN